MLPLFSQLLKDYLVRRNVAPAGGGVTPPERVVFGPPDRTFVGALQPGQTVNVYLADLRENRQLRSNERIRSSPNGSRVGFRETLPPAWVDGHYLITAWDTSNDTSRQALKEQEILRNVSAALLSGDPFTPANVYDTPATEPSLNNWPVDYRVPGLPYAVLPPEGFPKISEFWTTMGTGSVWKPVIYLVASIPVQLDTAFEYPAVTSMTTTVGQTKRAPGRQLVPGTDRVWYQIGGFVQTVDNQSVIAVPGARVVLQLSGDRTANPVVEPIRVQETRADDEGRFQFLLAGPLQVQTIEPDTSRRTRVYQVLARARGFHETERDVNLDLDTPRPHDVLLRRL